MSRGEPLGDMGVYKTKQKAYDHIDGLTTVLVGDSQVTTRD